MSPITRQYYRVPRGDREVYIQPPAADLPALVDRNRRLTSSYDFTLSGRPVAEFRAAARAEIMQLARGYARKWGFALDREWAEPAPIILTGHQPPPFHPGVWIKNFLAGSLASAVGGVGLNLTVDTDEARGQVYRFPAGRPGEAMADESAFSGSPFTPLPAEGEGAGVRGRSPANPSPGLRPPSPSRGEGQRHVALNSYTSEVRVAEIAMAPPLGGAAFEEQGVAAFDAGALAEVLGSVPPALAEPLRRCGAGVQAAAPAATSLAEAFAVVRRKEEEELGLRNYELPVSAMADTAAFLHFVAWMLAEHERVFDAYNGALAEYRRVYHERSAAQPMPDLARDGRRIELPLWIWRAGGQRRKLWVEPGERAPETHAPQAGRLNGLALFAEHQRIADFNGEDLADTGVLAARLTSLRQAGWKIRPRALSMTLFVRLAVGDVFIHGLGGAIYDKITDAMFERLWGVRPPEIVLASCTVFLPLPGYPATPQDLVSARRAVRDWLFNPDRRMSAAVRQRPEVEALASLKQQLFRTMRAMDREDRRRAFQRIHEINEALARFQADGPAAAQKELARIEREMRYNAILRNREYAFCFYPAQKLAAFYREATRIADCGLRIAD
jgi:hypothetical protein